MPEPCVPHMQALMILQQYITLYGQGLISVIIYPEIPREKLKVYLDSPANHTEALWQSTGLSLVA